MSQLESLWKSHRTLLTGARTKRPDFHRVPTDLYCKTRKLIHIAGQVVLYTSIQDYLRWITLTTNGKRATDDSSGFTSKLPSLAY